MSGIAAILRFDGRPAATEAIRAMTGAMDYRGPDGIEHWTNGGAALGHCMFRTTAESLTEVQPLTDETGALRLVMDGWLANPEELRTELQGRGARLRDRSDAELLLKAYLEWGEDCARHIDGEWAFLVWDERTNRGFAARDPIGMRPLHWHWDGRRLVVASDIGGVLAAGDIEVKLNPGMVAEHLVNEWYSIDETLWQGVMRLPPAHTMRIDENGPRLVRYWSPPIGESLRYQREEDYHDHYRGVLIESVRRASRSHLPVGCGVSGGLDSSAVFGAGQQLMRDGRFQAPGFNAYTWWLDPVAFPETNERKYVEAVEAFWGTPIKRLTPFIADDLGWYADRGRADRDMPPYLNASMTTALADSFLADGTRVVLNGEGGDMFLSGTRTYYADQIRSRDWPGLCISFAADRQDLGLGSALRLMARFGLAPNMPKALRGAWKRRRARRMDNWIGLGLDWLSPNIKQELLSRRLAFLEDNLHDLPQASRRSLLATLNDGYINYANEFHTRCAARTGYEPRSPYFSREIVEFTFRVPENLRRRGKFAKYLHRTALRGNLLPQAVADRTTKAYYETPYLPNLDALRNHVSACIVRCDIDGLNREGVRQLCDPALAGLLGGQPIFELWAIFGLLVLSEAESQCRCPVTEVTQEGKRDEFG